MKIKHVLLGSVMGLASAQGAFAADAIVAAEPEPAEYVKVCDAFGTGYFYIPGTETCLQIGGYIRYDMRGGELLGLDTDGDGRGDAWSKRVRFQLKVSTASDTEYGALKTVTDLRFNRNDDADTATNLYRAYIDFAGFHIGQDESTFITFLGNAGTVLNDDLIPYGPTNAKMITYTFKADNLSVVGGVENDNGAGEGYIPNAVFGAKYKTDDFAVGVIGAYDEGAEEGVIKARVDGTMGDLSVFLMGAYNTGDVKNFYANWNGDWAIWGGGSYKMSDMATLNLQLSYDEAEEFAAAAGVGMKLASGFAITPEVAYKEKTNGDKLWGGMVRFQRSF